MSEVMGNVPSSHFIKEFDASSEEDIEKVWQLWQAIFPAWPISRERMHVLLTRLSGQHGLHDHGFCLSLLADGTHALLADARSRLKAAATAAGASDLDSFEIGSSAPRLWPQMPADIPQGVKDFFSQAGFRKTKELGVRDLYKDIRDSIAPQDTITRTSTSKLKFTVWSPELAEECLAKQRSLFTWSRAYEILAKYEQFDQVMVAIDPETNAQVGWTLMCDSSAILSQIYAFMPLMPSGDKTGLVAAVGVDESARGKGVGLALMVKALESLQDRGVEGVLVDSVEIRGFYERLGFETKWDYESWKFQ